MVWLLVLANDRWMFLASVRSTLLTLMVPAAIRLAADPDGGHGTAPGHVVREVVADLADSLLTHHLIEHAVEVVAERARK